MAYTRTPAEDTYSSPIVAAAYGIALRPNSKYIAGQPLTQDPGMVNLLPLDVEDGKQGEMYSCSRHAIQAVEVANSDLINRGCYVWEKSAGTVYYFCVCGTGVYTSTDAVTWTSVTTLATSATTPVRFTEYEDDTNTKKLILVDGIECWIFTDNTAGIKVTDVNFPSPHLPFPVFMDGYLFLVKAGTADIYNSNLNDPTTWTPGDFLSSELYPDDLQALVKDNNYILAIGLEGCEYFYDGANDTGSPLTRYEGGSLAFGTLYPNSVACNKHQVCFLAQNNDGEFVIKLVEDFKAKDANPTFIIPALNARLAAGATAAGVRGYFLRQSGHLFYVLAIQGDVSAPDPLNKVFALNLSNNKWTELRVGAAGDAPYPVYFTANANSANSVVYVSGHYGGTPFFGTVEETALAQDVFTNGAGTVGIYTEMRTSNQMFGTINLKTMSRLSLNVATGSSTTASSGAAVTLQVSWSDDDYATFSSPRDLVFSPSLNYPSIMQLGVFRQRAFKIVYTGTEFIRYNAIIVDINKGLR